MKSAFMKLDSDKRHEIIMRGIIEFSTKSFADASTEAVAADTGIAKGSLFYYFGSKKAMYLDLLQYCNDLIVEYGESSVITGDSFQEITMNFFRKRLRFYRSQPDITRFIARASREYNQLVYKEKQLIMNRYLDWLEQSTLDVIDKALSVGEFSVDLSLARQYTYMFWVSLSMYLLDRYRDDEERFYMSDELLEKTLSDYIGIMLHGICPAVIDK